MATCPNCQNVCDDSARFCPNCATPLAQQAGHPPHAPQGFQQAPPQGGHQAPPQQGYQAPPQQGYQAPPQQGYPAPQAPPAGYQAPPQGGFAQSPAPAPGGSVVQPVAPAPFSGPVAQDASPARPPQPIGAPGAAAAPAPSAVPAGFGVQQGPAPTPPAFAPPPPVLPKRSKSGPLRLIPFAIGPIITVGVLGFMFVGGGSCSSVEGTFESAGDPLGTFTFMPAQCRSGERMNVHGAILVGEGPTDGGVMVIQDPVKGPIVKVELPGSCQPPDHEVCTEVTIDKSECKVFKVKIRRTNTTVNDIRLMAGSLELDCQFKEGGTVKAKLDFDNCD